MRFFRSNLLIMLGLFLTIGASSVLADRDHKRPKNTGTLSVRTTEASYPVNVDGQFVGMSGVGSGAEFYLSPGFHTVEVKGPEGKIWRDDIEIRRDQKNCVCLKVVRETISSPCPYRFELSGPDRVTEGDLVTLLQ
jgi:hypothetical protein